jgi:5'-methylthioadenosine phosphorylase
VNVGRGRVAVVGGSSILGLELADELGLKAGTRRVPVAGGPVVVDDADDAVFLQRHGAFGYTPPHRIDHHAHAEALATVGCDRVVALSSVGGLRVEHGVGTVLVPDDFFALLQQPDSRFADERGHSVPGFDTAWRARVLASWATHAAAPPVDGGVYAQVTGPRFETPAEVRVLAAFADVVGMTVGTESVAMRERGLAYAAVCIVDNLANGLGDSTLTVEEFEAGKAANQAALLATLPGVLAELVA